MSKPPAISPVADFWSLVAEIDAGHQSGRVTILEAVEQIYPAEQAVQAVLAEELAWFDGSSACQPEEVPAAGCGLSGCMPVPAETILARMKRYLRRLVGWETFNLPFDRLRVRGLKDDCLMVEVPKDSCEVRLRSEFQELLFSAFKKVSSGRIEVAFEGTPGSVTEGELDGTYAMNFDSFLLARKHVSPAPVARVTGPLEQP